MPKKIHEGPTLIVPVRMEMKLLQRLDRYARRAKRKCDYAERDDFTRNAIIVTAVKNYLADVE